MPAERITDSRTRSERGVSRRHLLTGGVAAAAGAAVALGGDRAARAMVAESESGRADAAGSSIVPFFGAHQAGIATPPQAHAVFIAFDLRDDVDRDGIRRLLVLLTDDAARLTAGRPPLGDQEPELAEHPANLTVTFGFGPRLVERVDPGKVPSWLGPLPSFGIDRLEARWSDGDLMLQLASDDPVTLAHALRMLRKDARAFTTVRWVQPGFRRAHGTEQPGATMRNLFGQLDGTVNPQPGSDDFDRLVWVDDAGWLSAGTSLVLRRIAMDLDAWDELDRPAREQSVGRTLATGAPLTGADEHDEPDLTATNAIGLPVIPAFAHIRRARTGDVRERIFRRAYNYETPEGSAGLLFGSFQADPERQFVPIQRRLDELDLLNVWTTPIGSAVFAVPPGCAEGGFIGESMF
ncbi:Dyp-type peroxidase [Ruicaihuangia caeni]|uniref:Dyp-type peroxidase n=1 Tax=Ruicaihuangia caeni TaxID=3042517 RepID=A0AAW6T915_9MICO|nr:Dyp-type peroxidase [Klugiella sp. YN-L-19]MDI2098268.1 Dyp-type peroxidase [Klugiella sp. YN-L-19]